MHSFTADMTANLFGNPHSASASSQCTTLRIENVRDRVLRFFNANPSEFDLCWALKNDMKGAIGDLGVVFLEYCS